MSIAALLILIALVLFVLSAFGIGGRINLQSAGLVCIAGAMLASLVG